MATSHKKTADFDTSARSADSSLARKSMQVAPTLPYRRPRIQYGMGTLFVIMSIGGPIIAGAMVLPGDFYHLSFQLVMVVALVSTLILGFSLCRPRWAFFVTVVALIFGIVVHVAVAVNWSHLSELARLVLLVSAWGMMLATGGGFILSFARYDQ